jgi:hypothetical protein
MRLVSGSRAFLAVWYSRSRLATVSLAVTPADRAVAHARRTLSCIDSAATRCRHLPGQGFCTFDEFLGGFSCARASPISISKIFPDALQRLLKEVWKTAQSTWSPLHMLAVLLVQVTALPDGAHMGADQGGEATMGICDSHGRQCLVPVA